MFRASFALFVINCYYTVTPFQWTSTPADGAVIKTCVGDNVSLPWNFTLDDGETILNIEWYYLASGQAADVPFASYSQNHFTLRAAKDSFSFLPNAGLVLHNARQQDSGVYMVRVNSHDHRDLEHTAEKSVNLIVAVPPRTSDGELHVTQRSDPVKDEATGRWMTELHCGHFTDLGIPAVSPVWTTPSGQKVNSTRNDNGTFVLSLATPVQPGSYTCHLPPSHPATLCLPPAFPLTTPAPLQLDEKDVRLSLLETRQKEMMEQLQHLVDINGNQSRWIQEQGQQIDQQANQIHRLESENNNLTSQVDQLKNNTPVLSSCGEWLQHQRFSGVRTIYMDPTTPMIVYCDQDTDSGSWTVFQRRLDGTVDFYRNWTDYETGFGDPERDFWLGLQSLHILTSKQRYELRVDLMAFNGTTAFATYSNFSVGDSSDNYTMNFDNYTGGTAGDSLLQYDNNGQQFSTLDADHDGHIRNCADLYHGGWWFTDSCGYSNLNGQFRLHEDDAGLAWFAFKGFYSLKSSEMKIRPMQTLD